MRAARAIWIASVCAALAAGGAFAATAYVQVVDEAGTPIPGATVSAYWFEKTSIFSAPLKSGEGTFVSDEKGLAAIPLNWKAMVTLRGAAKEGYAFEGYLNQNRDFLSAKRDTASHPRPIVLRALEPASFLLEVGFGEIRHTEGPRLEFSVDLFKGFRRSLKNPPYDDFFVAAEFEKKDHRWKTIFWTTNANCGLVATTVRQFTAPESGYRTRVEVPHEVITNKAFTLYIKSREPHVYVMIPFGENDLRLSATPVFTFWDFDFRDARINPYGGREMERDGRTNGFNSELRDEVLQALLKEHQYPPKPDIEARMANSEKRIELHREIINVRKEGTVLRNKIKEIEDRMSGKKSQKDIDLATEEYRKRLSDIGDVVQKCTREINRLEEEAHTLNLPEEGKRE